MNHETIEIAVMAIEKSFLIPCASPAGNTRTTATFREDFHREKRRLSGKPLLRPVRRRPAASAASVELAREEAARRLLQDGMPPRSRIQAILDRRPDRDPWLDDEYDWRP